MANTISREELASLIESGQNINLIEVLPEKYYREGHLPGAVQMNYDEVEQKVDELLPDRTALVVTYCSSDTCPNSAYAADALIERGYINVRKYAGGKKDWTDSGNQLET